MVSLSGAVSRPTQQSAEAVRGPHRQQRRSGVHHTCTHVYFGQIGTTRSGAVGATETSLLLWSRDKITM